MFFLCLWIHVQEKRSVESRVITDLKKAELITLDLIKLKKLHKINANNGLIKTNNSIINVLTSIFSHSLIFKLSESNIMRLLLA